MGPTTFSLAGGGLKLDTSEDLQSHVNSLVESEEITHIDLSGNTFGVSACKALSWILSSKSSTLQSIDLHDIFTSRLLEEIPPALSSLLNALLGCPHLHTIDLSDNAFGLNTKDPLVDFLSKHVPLRHLVLNNNGMGPIAGASMANALTALADKKAAARKAGREAPELESIVCGRNRLENGSMRAWAQAYEAHKSGIRSVKMTQNGIRQDGVSHLLRSGLSYCKALEVLDLQDNTFTIKGARALAEVLPSWTKLKELGVGDDLLGAKGSIEVFKALARGASTNVEVLRLQYNDITSSGVQALLQTAKTGLPRLRRVELNGNKFNEDDIHIQDLIGLLEERRLVGEAEGPADAEDFWGLDELDELEDESSDEDEDEDEDEDDDDDEDAEEAGAIVKAEKEQAAKDKERYELEVRVQVEIAQAPDKPPVPQSKDREVDELAKAFHKTGLA